MNNIDKRTESVGRKIAKSAALVIMGICIVAVLSFIVNAITQSVNEAKAKSEALNAAEAEKHQYDDFGFYNLGDMNHWVFAEEYQEDGCGFVTCSSEYCNYMYLYFNKEQDKISFKFYDSSFIAEGKGIYISNDMVEFGDGSFPMGTTGTILTITDREVVGKILVLTVEVDGHTFKMIPSKFLDYADPIIIESPDSDDVTYMYRVKLNYL